VSGQPDRLACERLGDAGDLEHDPARLHDGDPALGVPLTGPLTGLGGLLRVGLVREDVDPDLAATTDVPRHRDTSRLDLTVRDPPRLDGHEAVLAEVDRRPAFALAAHPPAVLLAVLGLLGHQHRYSAPP
jgi:hypothetical protein